MRRSRSNFFLLFSITYSIIVHLSLPLLIALTHAMAKVPSHTSASALHLCKRCISLPFVLSPCSTFSIHLQHQHPSASQLASELADPSHVKILAWPETRIVMQEGEMEEKTKTRSRGSRSPPIQNHLCENLY